MAISRRKFLLGGGVVAASWVTWSGVPAWGLAPAPSSAQFMELSSLLVNHRLDAAIGARMALWAAAQHADFPQMTAKLVGIAQSKRAGQVEDFFDQIPAGPLQDFAHWVIFAWYTGCSGPQKNAVVFTYEDALTYKTTADAVAIPSYGFSGPNQWGRPLTPLSPMPSF